jgi:hypothetical protein
MTGFFAALLFVAQNPNIVVQGGIHYHHFWYRIGMITLPGWLGSFRDSNET